MDDWAWRKGQRYGTILVDLERHWVIDLLPDREPDTLVAWLRAYQGAEFISRDRAGDYADAARRGAPDAIQIADRFHLLRNLTDAAQHELERHHADVRAIGLDAKQPTSVLLKRGGPVSRIRTTKPADLPLAEQRKLARRARRQSHYDEMSALCMAAPASLCADDECWQHELRLHSFWRHTFTKIRADPIVSGVQQR